MTVRRVGEEDKIMEKTRRKISTGAPGTSGERIMKKQRVLKLNKATRILAVHKSSTKCRLLLTFKKLKVK